MQAVASTIDNTNVAGNNARFLLLTLRKLAHWNATYTLVTLSDVVISSFSGLAYRPETVI